MKRLLILSAFISLVTISCKKTESCELSNDSLNGKWRMVSVKENTSGVTTTKPSSVAGEVDLIITTTNPAAGTFTGTTPTNTIFQNNFLLGASQEIAIPNLSITKVTETSWGTEFVDNIRNAETYRLETGDKLHIKTSSKTLTFKKLDP